MTATNFNKKRAKRLIAIFIAVFIAASTVIWLTLSAGQTVIAQSQKLTDYRIPELREISSLQMATTDRATQLYIYYATFDSQVWEAKDQLLKHDAAVCLEALKKLGLTENESEKFSTLAVNFSKNAQLFDEEMKKGDARDWDLLRTHLADAQLTVDSISALLNEWSEKINSTAQNSGLTVLNQIDHLTHLQLGFSIAVMIISAFVLIALYARLKDQDALYKRAYFDDTTGLPNLQRFEYDLKTLLRSDAKGSLLVVQIDRLKVITSTYGHTIADQMIIEISGWIKTKIQTKPIQQPSQLYRINSDSFAIIYQQSFDVNDAIKVAYILSQITDHTIAIHERNLRVNISIGITVFPDQNDSAAGLLRNAVAALTARGQTSNIHVFEPRMTQESETWLSTESALRAAIENHEFELHYQPKVDARTLSIMSSEALIRWRHKGALISPAAFIPVAEESGLIIPIGNWVMREACRQWRTWKDNGLINLPIAINISAQQFQDPTFLGQVEETLKQYNVPPEMIELEITEAVAANNPESAVATMIKLKEIGVSLAIDDFGTGYSSLSYLKRFPIDTLKIDIAFVRNIHTSTDDAAIAGLILALGRQLNLKVVAEGVEIKEQQVLLAAQGCDILQGYLFSKPLPAEVFAQRITAAESEN